MENRHHRGSIVGGMILILFGLLALLGQIFRGYDFFGTLWPFFVIGFGLLFFVGMLMGGKSSAGLAIPGTIITVIGIMLFLQNLTGYWESWSYGWTVILIAVGLGIFIMGTYNGNAHSRQAGVRVMGIGFIMLIIFGAFFEMIFASRYFFSIRQFIFPIALILLGAWLVLVRTGLLGGRRHAEPDQPEKPSTEQEQK